MNEFEEQKKIFKRIYDEDREVSDLLIKKIHNDIIPREKSSRKLYTSLYTKFDKIRRKRK